MMMIIFFRNFFYFFCVFSLMNDLYTFDLLILLSGRASNLINHNDLMATLSDRIFFFHFNLPANFSSKIEVV